MKNYGVVELSEATYIEMTDEIERLRGEVKAALGARDGMRLCLDQMAEKYDAMRDENERLRAARDAEIERLRNIIADLEYAIDRLRVLGDTMKQTDEEREAQNNGRE